MAIGIEGAKTWRHDPNQYNIKHMDAALLSDGRIVLGYAGTDTTTLDGYVATGILNLRTDTLTQIKTRIYEDAPGGGQGFNSVTEFDLVAGPGGRLTGIINLMESAVGDDVNGALLLQRFDGSSFLGAPVAADPARLTDNLAPATGAVFHQNGSYSVFYTANSPADPSTGIYMAHFAANGTPLTPPEIVIADHTQGGIITMDANPIEVDAAALSNGTTGLVWTESSAFAAPTYGQPRVMYQAVADDGTALGTAVEIDGTSARSAQIVALQGGGAVVVWLDTTPGDQGIYKAQVIAADGAKQGGVFELSSSISTQEYGLQVIALENGGFATAWRDVNTGTHLARMFDANGKATGADFLMLDTDTDFISGEIGLITKGNQLITYLHGLNGAVGSGFVVQGQTWSTENSYGIKFGGTTAADTKSGGAKDDILNGGRGGDVLRGSGGNDALSGGKGRDVLNGGDGCDQLQGGVGADRLTGGAGPDSFVWKSAAEGGDRIIDFNQAEDDRLILYKDGFGGATGVLSGATTNANHIGVFFNTTTQELSYDSDGAGATARVLIAKLEGVSALDYYHVLFV